MSHSQEPSAEFPIDDVEFDINAVFADMSVSDLIVSSEHQVDRLIEDTDPFMLHRFRPFNACTLLLADVIFSKVGKRIDRGVVGKSDNGLYVVSADVVEHGVINPDASYAWWKGEDKFITDGDSIFTANMGSAEKNLTVARAILPFLIQAVSLDMTQEMIKDLSKKEQNPDTE